VAGDVIPLFGERNEEAERPRERGVDVERLPDQEDRDRITTDLETNFLVEAGAGSGKTTALVDRMVALVRSGEAVGSIAAVTFTRKAAAELRERFQDRLEEGLVDTASGPEERQALESALKDVDQAFIGTIHAFCAHLLRERPIEARVDPGFDELLEFEASRMRRRFWATYLERAIARDDPAIEALDRIGLKIHRLEDAFNFVAENLDLAFPVQAVEAPSHGELARVRHRLEELLDRALPLLPSREPDGGWDSLMIRLRSLRWSRRVAGWDDERELYRVLEELCGRKEFKVTQKRWSTDSRVKAQVKAIRAEFDAFIAEGGAARDLLARWYASRYPTAIELVITAAGEFRDARLRSGRLSFQDLLLVTAQLLRENPRARRDLGRRYRRLLVDEFQDTDPIQAEVVFLLASDPGDDDAESWWRAEPRPGALFVVGDPKQSIYRFRRADIALYNKVKARFREFGEVLHLNANFRSGQPIARIVNEVFRDADRFPENETPYQAPFAPLLPRPRPKPPAEGVFEYWVEASRVGELAALDAHVLASWIKRRVDRGERPPGDFMILTRKKKHLHLYARALEDRALPIDVSGAGVGLEDEMEALMHLLEALVDPANPVLVVAVLVGLFFGLDHEELLAHRLDGGWFDFTRAVETPGSRVEVAFQDLRRWWLASRTEPADVLIERLVAELGLFPHAAAGDLGSVRVGALAYALDAVRAHAAAGDTSLVGALDALGAALEWDDAEAPLEPGRTDAVRVMNLHKAKGLEARVVILAEPGRKTPRGRNWHVETGDEEERQGWVVVEESREQPWGGRTTVPLARPMQWDRMAEEELRFEDAEEARLLYVAATRAMDELVVARRKDRPGSPWDLFDAWLDENAQRLDLGSEEVSGAPGLRASATELEDRVKAAERDRAHRAGPTYLFESVTEIAKRLGGEGASEGPAERSAAADGEGSAGTATVADGSETGDGPLTTTGVPAPTSSPRGYEWGTVVHAALAAAARGLESAALREVCRSLLVENERPVDESGAPRELEELLILVSRVQRSELWARAMRSSRRYPEIPFAAPSPGAPGTIPEMIEGVIDLAFREADGWVVADYKTDVGDDPDFPRRAEAYRRQVDLYAQCWSALTGDPVKERILVFTAQGREDRW
jgi:ATP-dependent helicase/nuclease subunit A